MKRRTVPIAWSVVFASLAAQSYAAELDFQPGHVTESRTYYREVLYKAGFPAAVAQPAEMQVQRVTVELDGERVTAEWNPSMSRWPGMLAKDFPLDADVHAAIRGNELRLVHPELQCAHSRLSAAPCRAWATGWVRARIVKRAESEEFEGD